MDEVEKHLKEAKKASSKGFLKKPNWDAAASHYEAAAQGLMTLDGPNVAETWREASSCHEKAGNWFFAGKSLQLLADYYRRKKDAAQYFDIMQEAAQKFIMACMSDKEAEVLCDSAKNTISLLYPFGFTLSELSAAPTNQKLIARALDSLGKAYDVLETAEQWHRLPDPYNVYLTNLVRAGMYREGAALASRHAAGALVRLNQPEGVFDACLTAVILYIAADDVVAAERQLEESHPGFYSSEPGSCAVALVAAVNAFDEDALAAATKHPHIPFLNNEVARLTKSRLRVTGKAKKTGGAALKPSAVVPTAQRTPSPDLTGDAPVNVAAAEDDDDDLDLT